MLQPFFGRSAPPVTAISLVSLLEGGEHLEGGAVDA